MRLYLVMQFVAETPQGGVFEISGIFDSHETAIAACRDWTYGVHGPFELNRQMPHESGEHGVSAEYPILRTAS